jgi:hypothetical protein
VFQRLAKYSSPRRLAAAISGADPTARSYSSSPYSTQIVAWNDERELFGAYPFARDAGALRANGLGEGIR